MIAPVTHISPIATFRRERVLPFPGRILVRRGQKVSATDVVAEASHHSEHLLIDVVRALGVPLKQVDKYIKIEEGTPLEKGDLLAGPVGFLKRRIYSPCLGQVILVDNGQILIEVTGKPFHLRAGVPGEVVDFITDKGVTIESTGALIQGVWGNGKIEYGLMSVQAKKPDHVLTVGELDESLRGSILFAGYCDDIGVLRVAEELPLRGLILGSLSTNLLAKAQKLAIPLLVTEGFGRKPLNSVAFKLLSTNDRREIALNAEAWDSLIGTRPEIVIPLPGSGVSALKDSGVFASDQQVRALRAPYAGKIGILMSLKGMYLFPNGLHTSVAEVRLETGEIAIIPLANLELIA